MLTSIKKSSPLVHCITNYVVANFTANGLLAIGASPVMADEVEEVADMVAISQGLLINIGTVNSRTVDSMLVAGRKANALGIPIVLDPVGIGATAYRKKVVMDLLSDIQFQCIRCNAGELAAIAGVSWEGKGVDSGIGNMDIVAVAKKVATIYKCLVVVTGPIDIVTDGQQVTEIDGGNELATRVTGMGCLLSAICAATLAVAEYPLQDIASVLRDYKQAAEQLGSEVGTFAVQFTNSLQKIAEGSK